MDAFATGAASGTLEQGEMGDVQDEIRDVRDEIGDSVHIGDDVSSEGASG
ncbi:hypothetical protein [Natrarchaeobius chitinivorans]|nr:hypothetical protein [Natrarchaeobius chitinivorans]